MTTTIETKNVTAESVISPRPKSRNCSAMLNCSTNRPEVYYAFSVGDVKFIMLDTRFYRQNNKNNENATLSNIAITSPESPLVLTYAGLGQIDTEITNLNVSVGVRATTNFSIGATLTYSELEAK